MVRQPLVSGPVDNYKSTHHLWDDTTPDAKEKVSKRILAQGPTDEQYLRYIGAGQQPLAVGDFQQNDPTFDNQGRPEWDYQVQDGIIDHIRIQPGQVFAIEQKPNTTISQGGYVFGEAGTGLGIPESAASSGDIALGIAEETNVVLTDEEGEILTRVFPTYYKKP